MPSLTTLTLRDFPVLPIERVAPFLTELASLETLCFRYCNLVSLHQPESYIPMLPEDHSHTSIYQLPASYYYYNTTNPITIAATATKGSMSPEGGVPPQHSAVKTLILDWTDFSATAIDNLLHRLPCLGFVSFGANHNRIKNANNVALTSLKHHCQHIHSLKVALQQIHPLMLPLLIEHYGPQLRQLDIQCQDTTTLKTVAQYATKVEQLVIHAVGSIQQQPQQQQQQQQDAADNDDDDDDDDWTLEEVKDDDEDDDNQRPLSLDASSRMRIDRKTAAVLGSDGIEGIVRQCGELTHMEMISWGLRDIPSVILRAMAHRRKQQRLQASFNQSDYATTRTDPSWHHHRSLMSTWSEKASLALDGDLLAEIRTLFVCV
ncbi:hypothetical protein BCR42DRAFT_421820 [Absidia repens]|uniref:Uncharacterized protein n=1 Tax=Absidia repens TaxID=90262 RepID=A0A1X2I9H2_9FUNG|nr:hypothetical protein BCR42DRAFT_421820 [Absidia repens]